MARQVLRTARRLFPFIERIFADAGYQGPKMEKVVADSRRSTPSVFLEIEIREGLAGRVLYEEARIIVLLDRPWWRKVAGLGHGHPTEKKTRRALLPAGPSLGRNAQDGHRTVRREWLPTGLSCEEQRMAPKIPTSLCLGLCQDIRAAMTQQMWY
jgi:hypothetical protein